MACCGPSSWPPGHGAPDHSDRLASRMLPAGAVPGRGGTDLARSCNEARAARGERPVNAPGESGQDFSQAVARVWDSYDAAVKEAQAGVMKSAGRVLSGLVEVTALLPVSAVDLPGTALRLDGLATDLAKAAQALREVIDDGR